MGGERSERAEGPSSEVRRAPAGPRAGRIAEVTGEGFVLVRVGEGDAVRAWVASSLPLARLVAAAREGTPVLVDFLDGDPTQPVVTALLVDRVAPEAPPRRLELEATESITLACGAGALELRRDGHVEMRGHEVRVESEGVVAVRGTRIDLN